MELAYVYAGAYRLNYCLMDFPWQRNIGSHSDLLKVVHWCSGAEKQSLKIIFCSKQMAHLCKGALRCSV